MRRSLSISPAECDFWLDADRYSNYFSEVSDPSNKSLIFNTDMIILSSIRKAISNFVRILTRKSIPVYFNDEDETSNFDGKIIYISAKITSKQDFDVAVGQALHEGAHTILTDFEMAKLMWANIPHHILKLSDEKNIRRSSIERFLHGIWNVVEDRYIDDNVFNSAPGYRGYYVAFYDRFWNNPMLDQFLKSDLFRIPSLESYDFQITNFTNENVDLMALPCLDDIARTIDISHINRLTTTRDRIECAFKITEIVLDCLDKQEENSMPGPSKVLGMPSKSNRRSDGLADPRDYFDFGDEQGEEKEKSEAGGSQSDQSDQKDIEKDIVEEISDIMSGRNPNPSENPKENDKLVNQISSEPLSKQDQKNIDEIRDAQRRFLFGEIPKDKVTPEQKEILDIIEKHGIILVQVEVPNLFPEKVLAGDEKNLKVDCIVVQKMTKDLIFSGQQIFPLTAVMPIGGKADAPEDVAEAVRKGIALGTKLGRKLQVRTEINPHRIIRKRSGKINKRQLHEAAFDAEDLFYKIFIEEHNHATIHITVDASSSMSHGAKWTKTMTAVVAICKAASMVDNIHVTVSFRSTQMSHRMSLPYIVLAYDSKKDKFSKVRQLFPYLQPNGFTPEGLAFGAIMNLFEGITPDEEDRYFLNLSDGEPCFILRVPGTYSTITYQDEVGVNHTKAQVDKIRKNGVQILSYFIEDGIEIDEKNSKDNILYKNFQKMYGKNAKFVDVESVIDLAKTINGLFLMRANEKIT